MVRLLLEHRADPNLKMSNGQTPLDYAWYAAVVFVKKEAAVQVSAESPAGESVSLDDMEALAKKIAVKINSDPGQEAKSHPQPKDKK